MPALSVLHVLAPAPVGGLEAVVPALALGARESGIDARVAAVLPGAPRDHPFLAPFRDGGQEIYTVHVPRRGYLYERGELTRLYRRVRPDVVHTHGYRADVLDAPVARRLGIPVVSTVHGFGRRDRMNRLYHWLQRRALREFHAVVAVSRGLLEGLAASGVPRERLHYIQNAWKPTPLPLERGAARAALGIAPGSLRLGWVGRLSEEKGPDVLLAALGAMGDLPLTASVIGDGPQEGALKAQAARAGIGDRIGWHGVVPGAGRLLRAFDVLVLSSRAEGTPIVLLEAMAAGVPIVASHVGGVPDLVSPAEALLVPPGDPQALASAVRQVVQNQAAARDRAQAARERLENDFALSSWLARYEAVYRAVCRHSECTGDTRH